MTRIGIAAGGLLRVKKYVIGAETLHNIWAVVNDPDDRTVDFLDGPWMTDRARLYLTEANTGMNEWFIDENEDVWRACDPIDAPEDVQRTLMRYYMIKGDKT